MSPVLRNESLAPFTGEMYLSVIPGAYRQREMIHKRLGDARGRVSQNVMQRWKGQSPYRHLGAAIFKWSDSHGRWDVVDEIDPGESIKIGQMPWQVTK